MIDAAYLYSLQASSFSRGYSVLYAGKSSQTPSLSVNADSGLPFSESHPHTGAPALVRFSAGIAVIFRDRCWPKIALPVIESLSAFMVNNFPYRNSQNMVGKLHILLSSIHHMSAHGVKFVRTIGPFGKPIKAFYFRNIFGIDKCKLTSRKRNISNGWAYRMKYGSLWGMLIGHGALLVSFAAAQPSKAAADVPPFYMEFGGLYGY